LKDLSAREVAIMMPLLIFIFWIGIYPNTFLDKMNPALENMIEQVKGKQQIAMVVEDMDQAVTQITVND
jgi:NADH-quinone oxidoreductase subunit M